MIFTLHNGNSFALEVFSMFGDAFNNPIAFLFTGVVCFLVFLLFFDFED